MVRGRCHRPNGRASSAKLEIKRIHADLGTTFVYVTHDQDEALVLSDRIAVFDEGRIKQVDTPSELYERPNSVLVAQFLGESTCSAAFSTATGASTSTVIASRLPAATRGERSSGASGAVVVRPERIHLHPDGPQPHGANVLPGRVVQHIYFGTSRKVEVRLDDGSTALVRESAGAALTSVHGDDGIWLTVESDDATLPPIDDDDVPEPSTLDTDN